ncbi:MAG: STAS domain-containing protein [Ginsengibacter sp.]
MKVKIDTKEKFHVVSIEEAILSANMTEDLSLTLLSFLDKTPKSLVINFEKVEQIDAMVANTIVTIQQTFYHTNCSFVLCNLAPGIETFLDNKELLELMNVTPTESEAWDIVQLEEIEREFN